LSIANRRGIHVLANSRLIAFVATAKPDAAGTFYAGTLGLRLIADTPTAIVFDSDGVMLRIAKVQSNTLAQHTVFGWRVHDIRAAIDSLGARGVTFERYPGFNQDDRGIWTSPDGAQVAWFRDPDGNVLSLTRFPQ
jgi:catechol 2,3-dioxygenase-like lactoylglutathione lyase family enzyme